MEEVSVSEAIIFTEEDSPGVFFVLPREDSDELEDKNLDIRLFDKKREVRDCQGTQ